MYSPSSRWADGVFPSSYAHALEEPGPCHTHIYLAVPFRSSSCNETGLLTPHLLTAVTGQRKHLDDDATYSARGLARRTALPLLEGEGWVWSELVERAGPGWPI